MAVVRIGHASTNSKPAAEQVLIGNYYDGSWTFVLRPTTQALAIRSAAICEAGCKNDYIRYSQNLRHTFKHAAFIAAGLEETEENLAKITPLDISNIKEVCYADCSSFMTFCAIAGGARITYGENAATTSTMRTRFTERGDYEILTASTYLKSSDYLRRGDILVNDGHTVMILDNGKKAPTLWLSTRDGFLDITTIKLVAKMDSVGTTSARASFKISKVDAKEEKALNAKEELGIYEWAYQIKSLENPNEKIANKLKVVSAFNDFSFSGLKPNHSYLLKVIATEKAGEVELSSSNIIFTTAQAYPSAISNLSLKFNSTSPSDIKNFTVAFTAPSSWGNASLQKCYRLFLIVNGRKIASSDNVLKASDSRKTVEIKNITKKADLFEYGDIVQIGIQPGLKDEKGNFICDPNSLSCSKPVCLKNSLSMIAKIYIKLKNGFKRAIIYNR